MKKGMKGNSLKHKTAPLSQSGFIASIVAFITVAIVSLGTFAFNLWAICQYTPTQGSFIKDLGNVIISALSFITSIVGTCRSIKKLSNDSFNRQFLIDDTYKNSIKRTVGVNIDYQHDINGYKWDEYHNARYLHSEKVDEALSTMFPAHKNDGVERPQMDLLLRVSPKIQPLNSDQSEALYQQVKQKRASGKNIFNSKLVRLRTDLFTDGKFSDKNAKMTNKLNDDRKINDENELKFTDIGLVDIEKTDYYSNMTSNDLIYDRLFKYDHTSIYCGKDMTVNGDTLYNLSQSPAANIIGVTTLALTKDKTLVINKQDNNNDVNNDCYVPSGSGSADFDDLKACRKLEKKTQIPTYADKLIALRKSYKSLSLRKNRNNYKKIVSKKIKSFKNKDIITEGDFDETFKTAKDAYENGIKAKKEYQQLKSYCKKLGRYTCSFGNFIRYGMVRELIEESHVCQTVRHKVAPDEMKKLMDRTEICGYIRILDRGGKPDLFGITYLDASEEELRKDFFNIGLKVANKELKLRSAITDYSEVRSQTYITKKELLQCEKFEDLFPKTIDKKTGKKKEIKISLQLYYLLTIVKKKFQDEEAAKSTKNNVKSEN